MKGPTTLEQLTADLDRHGGNLAAVAREYGMPRRTLSNRRAKWESGGTIAIPVAPNGERVQSLPVPASAPIGSAIDGDTATVTLPAHPKRTGLRTGDEVLRDHGLDPSEWDIVSYNDNYWQGNDGEGPTNLTQSKVVAKRRIPHSVPIPARTDAPLRMPPRARRATRKPVLVALASDQHCPHQDEALEACWLEWLSVNKPQRILGMGDLTNQSKPHKKHRANLHARHNDTPSECFQAGEDWWRRTLAAAGEDVEAAQLPGNHDLRHQIATLESLPDLYDVKRPGEQYPWWDLEYMLGLDKLGVTYHRPDGEYHAAEVHIAPGLSVTHGSSAGPIGGAVKEMPRHEGSRAVGHDHKQSITHVVRYRDGEPRLHVAVSVGTMARRDLGYQPNPDTEQGFATVTVHPDGYWNIELARFDARRGRLVWRDQMYTA